MIEELMKAVLEGAQQQQQGSRRQTQQAPSGDILGEILKGVLGGAGQQQAQRAPTQPQMDNLGGIADILGGVLGGGTRGASTGNPIADMAANALAKRLGISPQIAAMVVSFAMAALLGKQQQQQATPGRRAPSRPSNNTARGGTFDGLDLDDLLDGDFAYESGLAAQLAGKTGQSEDEAAYQLQEAVSILTGVGQRKPKKASTKPKPALRQAPKSGGLDSLLDKWEVD